MRILYHHRTMADGAEGIHIREIVAALRALGHDVLVEALAGDPTQPTPPGRSKVASVRRMIPAFAYELAELAYNVVGFRRLRRAVHTFRPDVIYDRYNSYSTAALKTSRRTRIPLLLEVNAPIAYERRVYEHLPLKFPALARRYERAICSGADRIVAVSTPLKRHLVQTLGVDAGKIIVLPNGADPERFRPGEGRDETRRRYGISERMVIGFVGILRPWHGVDLLLDAFTDVRRTVDEAHLLIVGDGPMQHSLEARARELGIAERATFTGRLPHEAVVAHVAAMDIAVSPHATFYASPMKILEYLAMEKAVVAPAMDNIADILEDGVTGVLFDPENRTALADALRRVAADERLRDELGARGRRAVMERFNWRNNAQAVVAIAEEALRRRPA